MKIELLYFDDCPNWKIADERLHAIAATRDLMIERRSVTTTADAEAARFRGSPTILIDGHDPFANGNEPYGLACRIFQTEDGPAGCPSVAQLEAAVDG